MESKARRGLFATGLTVAVSVATPTFAAGTAPDLLRQARTSGSGLIRVIIQPKGQPSKGLLSTISSQGTAQN